MTSFLPLGGTDLSGVVIVILVGADSNGCRFVFAWETPAEPDEPLLLAFELLELLELEELLSEPHAASMSASASVAMTAIEPRAPRRPRAGPAGSV